MQNIKSARKKSTSFSLNLKLYKVFYSNVVNPAKFRKFSSAKPHTILFANDGS